MDATHKVAESLQGDRKSITQELMDKLAQENKLTEKQKAAQSSLRSAFYQNKSNKGVLFFLITTYFTINNKMAMFIISRQALAREGDYEMMPVCACVRACVRALVSHADSSKTTTATDFL